MKISIEALTDILNLQEEKQPLIHCISSMVTMNDLAQGILSYNGNPIMALGIDEIGEITTRAEAVLIDLGTLDNNKIAAMEKSLRIASRKNKPVVLDAVGVDISLFRKEIALIFLARYKIDVIKGNLLEIKELLEKRTKKGKEHKGRKEDKERNENEEIVENKEIEEIIKVGEFGERVIDSIKNDYEVREKMREFSKRYKTILIATGNENYVTDGFSEFFISNGNERFNKIVGVNSILAGLISVGVAVARTTAEKVQAVLIAIMTMGISQDIVCEKNKENFGLMSLKNSLIDEISIINTTKIEAMGKISYVFKR